MSDAKPIHDDGCDEWCNHCDVCGCSILYGSRCHAHPLVGVPKSIRGA